MADSSVAPAAKDGGVLEERRDRDTVLGEAFARYDYCGVDARQNGRSGVARRRFLRGPVSPCARVLRRARHEFQETS